MKTLYGPFVPPNVYKRTQTSMHASPYLFTCYTTEPRTTEPRRLRAPSQGVVVGIKGHNLQTKPIFSSIDNGC